jgi:tRNA(Ile2) C34 agmatinyltransferase TiaS
MMSKKLRITVEVDVEESLYNENVDWIQEELQLKLQDIVAEDFTCCENCGTYFNGYGMEDHDWLCSDCVKESEATND